MGGFSLAVVLVVACGMPGDAVIAKVEAPSFTVPRRDAVEVERGNTAFTISTKTTYVTHPLNKRGYVDYVGALNEAASKGVTVENNAAVLLVRAMDLSILKPGDETQFFKLLHVEPSRRGGRAIQDFPQFIATKSVEDGMRLVTTTPWSAREYPVLADWMAKQEIPLNTACEAVRRPRCYFPYVRPAGTPLYDIPLPAQGLSISIARALAARAMLRISQHKIVEARQDLLACHRLGRLVGSGPTLMDGLAGLSIEDTASHADIALVEFGNLNAAEALAYRDELRNLPPLPDITERFDRGERLLFLGFLCEQMRNFNDKVALLFFIPVYGDVLEAKLAEVWDLALETANKQWDRWTAAIRTPSPVERRKNMAELEAEFSAYRKFDPFKTHWRFLRESGRQLGRSTVALMLPNVRTAPFSVEDVRVRCDLEQVALAIRAYRSDHRQYPAELAALVPEYCGELPVDRFSGTPLRYVPRKSGYLLYSVGGNKLDDGGHGWNSRPQGDDVGLEIPTKGYPFATLWFGPAHRHESAKMCLFRRSSSAD